MRARGPKRLAFVLVAATCSLARAAHADPSVDDLERGHAPLAEPIFSETVTDLDGDEPGEFELEANGSILRARRGGAYELDASLEVEWLFARRLGVRVEPTISRDSDTSEATFGASAGASCKLLQDFAREVFLDLEALARLPWRGSPIVQPGDPAMPLAFDLRAGTRAGPLALRASAGVGAFGDAANVPLRASFAALLPIERSERFGFFGVEVDADGARRSPMVLAFEVVPNLVPAGIPFRLGVAVPWTVAERDDRPSLGLFVRIFYESARELDFAAGRVGQVSPRSSQ